MQNLLKLLVVFATEARTHLNKYKEENPERLKDKIGYELFPKKETSFVSFFPLLVSYIFLCVYSTIPILLSLCCECILHPYIYNFN